MSSISIAMEMHEKAYAARIHKREALNLAIRNDLEQLKSEWMETPLPCGGNCAMENWVHQILQMIEALNKQLELAKETP